MVKAPRSKGCRVCVSRRVKCDQRRPFCLRCQKADRQCPGYETIHIVDEGPSVRQLYQNVSRAAPLGNSNMGQGLAPLPIRESSASSTSSTSSRIKPVHQAPSEYLRVPEHSQRSTSPLRSENRTQDLERSTLVAIISPSAYRSQLLSSLIHSLSPSNSGKKLAPAYYNHSVWMSEIARRQEVSSTLVWAIRAISLSYLGLQMQDKNIIQNSRNMYGRALLKLNNSLQDPVEGLTSDTLSATILLSFYEFMICTEKDSWIRHAGGAGNLIRLRGPDRHRRGYDSSVFLSCRYTMMMEAFLTRRPCFLAAPEWKRLSRYLYENSEQKSPFHALREDIFQEMVDFPGFTAEAVDYMSTGSRDSIALRELIRRGHSHRSNYKQLHLRTFEVLKTAGQEPTVIPSPSGDTLFPNNYQYPNNVIGSHYCSYWSLTIVLNIVLIGLEAKLSELSSPEPHHHPDVNTSVPPPNQPGRSLPLLWLLTDRTRRTTSPSTSANLHPAGSPSDFPTMSEAHTTRRRQLYMAENILFARECCKSVESTLSGTMTMFLGPMFLVYTLRNALRVLSDETEQAWIIAKLTVLSKVFGVARTEVENFESQEGHYR